MKKTVKMMIAMVMVVLMLSITAIPSMAAGFNFGNDFSGFGSFETVEDEMSEILDDSQNGFKSFMEEAEKQREEFEKEIEEKKQQREEARQERWDEINREQKTMKTVVIVIVVVVVLLLIAEIAYIFITAPKCGMSRFWALVPLFSNLFGLLVFIVIRSNRMSTSNDRTVTCPTCNGVHPLGTTECSICGTKLS